MSYHVSYWILMFGIIWWPQDEYLRQNDGKKKTKTRNAMIGPLKDRDKKYRFAQFKNLTKIEAKKN